MKKDNPYAFWTSIGIFAGVGLIVVGLIIQAKRQMALLMDYCYKIKPKSFKLIGLSKAGIKFSLSVLLKNQSDVSATINGYSFDVYVNDIPLTKVSSEKESSFNAQSVNEIPLNVAVDFTKNKKLRLDQVLQIASYYITDKSKINIKITGGVSVKHSIISIRKMPISFNYSLQELLEPSTSQSTCKI